MTDYAAPLRDMRFVLNELVGLERIAGLPGCDQVTPDLVDAILEEAGNFAAGVLAPLNWPGDRQGARWENGTVRAADGFADAYARFVEAGWNSLGAEPEHGGQGLPATVATPVEEMWNSANMSFALAPLLTRGAIEALHLCGSDAQKRLYLPKMVTGEWTGTMNLTEPQAGSDLSAVRTRAVPEGDHYRITGQKIFITWGEHDIAGNIIHLVLARTPDAPEGVKGISLFVVPKFLVREDGSPGEHNDVRCVSIEHKLGIHASPTCVLAFGDAGGAVGYLVGEKNRGLEYMFIMMNMARFSVGVQGLAIAERALQHARAHALARVQGTETGVRGGPKVPIIRHPDVRRMLLSMKAHTEAMRALVYQTAAALDEAHHAADEAARAEARAFAELMIPVVKGWCTESAIRIASTGVQVHGGMGFVEETGAAQHYRDARILTIYEGTTGIQANDLVGRKLARDGGAAARAAIARMRATAAELSGVDLGAIGSALERGIAALEEAIDFALAAHPREPKLAAAGAVPLLELFGIVAGGWQMARAALVAQRRLAWETDGDAGFYRAKLDTAAFYAAHFLPQAVALREAVVHGSASVLALDEAAF